MSVLVSMDVWLGSSLAYETPDIDIRLRIASRVLSASDKLYRDRKTAYSSHPHKVPV